jgi:quercetin dioxygenase-like cupin family protein
MRENLSLLVLTGVAFAALPALTPAVAQAPPLLTQALPVSGDLDVQMVKYVLPPAGEKPTVTTGQPGHSHPGATYAYVIKGAVNSRLGAGPEIRYEAGATWSEKPGEAHYIANASKTEPAQVLVVFVLPRGAANTGPTPK